MPPSTTSSLTPTEPTILQEADRIVDGARQSLYGHPYENFTRIGRIWAAMLDLPEIPPETVGLMLVAVKLARETHLHSRDNLVDIAGYAKTVDMVHDYRGLLPLQP